jgi:subtilisin family serine protease
VFRGNGVSKVGLHRTPASMINALTVGSYDFNAIDDRFGKSVTVQGIDGRPLRLGDISSYSSPGYNRRGEVKPTVSAPGQWHVAPGSRVRDTEYKLFNGTSAACPYTAGVVALLLQKRPEITFGEIKTLFQAHATRDVEPVGRTPNPYWGYGKLDLPAIRRVLNAVR